MRYLLISLLIVGGAMTAYAGDFEEQIMQLAEAELEENATPAVEVFHNLINQGLYHNAGSHSLPGFDIGIRTMMVAIPDDMKEGLLDSLDIALVPFGVLQGSVGLMKGFQVTGRFLTLDLADFGKMTLVGGGARFEVNEVVNVPLVAPKVAVQYFFNRFSVGDVATANSSSFDIIVSKKFFIIEPYAGLGMSSTNMEFDYTYTIDNPPVPAEDVNVKADFDTSSTRLAFGLNFVPFPLVKLNAEYSMLSDYNQFGLGLIISFL